MTVTAASTAPSIAPAADGRGRVSAAHSVSSSGAKTTVPMPSPSHQVDQTVAACRGGTMPADHTAAVPTEAATAGAISPPTTVSRTTSPIRESSRRKPAARSSSVATRYSPVFPTDTRAATGGLSPVVALTRNAARKIAGHKRRPPRRTAARAMPVGGQTVVATPPSASKRSPSLAAAT